MVVFSKADRGGPREGARRGSLGQFRMLWEPNKPRVGKRSCLWRRGLQGQGMNFRGLGLDKEIPRGT